MRGTNILALKNKRSVMLQHTSTHTHRDTACVCVWLCAPNLTRHDFPRESMPAVTNEAAAAAERVNEMN